MTDIEETPKDIFVKAFKALDDERLERLQFHREKNTPVLVGLGSDNNYIHSGIG